MTRPGEVHLTSEPGRPGNLDGAGRDGAGESVLEPGVCVGLLLRLRLALTNLLTPLIYGTTLRRDCGWPV